MKSAVLYVWAAAGLLAAGAARAEFPGERMYQTVEVGPGVYAFIAPESNGPIPSGNVLAVVGDDGVLVVDSGRFPTLARRMVEEIRRRTDKPVRYLVHTHWHLDHIASDAVFREAFPGIVFVSTAFTRRKMAEKQIPYVRDLEKTDAGYVQYLQERIAGGQRRDGSPMTDDSGGTSRARSTTSGSSGGAVRRRDRRPDAHVRRRAPGPPRKARGPRRVSRKGQHRGRRRRDRSGREGRRDRRPPRGAGPYGYGCHPAEWIRTLDALTASTPPRSCPGTGRCSATGAMRGRLRRCSWRSSGRSPRAGPPRRHARTDAGGRRLSALRKTFAGDGFDRAAAFDDFFVRSAVDRAYQQAKGAMAEE